MGRYIAPGHCSTRSSSSPPSYPTALFRKLEIEKLARTNRIFDSVIQWVDAWKPRQSNLARGSCTLRTFSIVKFVRALRCTTEIRTYAGRIIEGTSRRARIYYGLYGYIYFVGETEYRNVRSYTPCPEQIIERVYRTSSIVIRERVL